MKTTNTKKTIQWTTNYGLFHPNPNQKRYVPTHIEELARKMKRHGFPPSMAISVYRKNSKLHINTGHHRVKAAEMLGIAVPYIIEDEWTAAMLADEGTAAKNWTTRDVAEHYANQGEEDYITLIDYAHKGIPINYAASMLRGEHAGSGNAGRTVRNGSFVVKTREQIDQLVGILEETKDTCDEASSQTFVLALSALLLVEEFDGSRLVKKIGSYPGKIEKCATRDQMLDQLEEVYNFKATAGNRVNLAFLAKNTLNNRKRTFGRA